MAAPLSFRLAVLAVLHVGVALLFLKGFLLTRVELPDTSSCTGGSCSSRPAYSKAVLLIVDALRYDFVCDDGSSSGSRRGRLPRTLGLVGASGGAAVVTRFVADTPTITMSRLKALLTGGLPTFLDVGQSFSASALSEDNLLQQLLAQGKRMVVMGDDTWMQLGKDMFAEAHPYPSFDVNDLHTVDDGVWEHLLPLLARPGSWDVLIGHYLGVDHAGHTYGVNSRQMEAKLAQMDSQVSHIIESLAVQAGPGGPYAGALLLVLSDHGQTLGGDHGGGTPDETDSMLLAISLHKMHEALQQHKQQTAQHANAATTGTLSAHPEPQPSGGHHHHHHQQQQQQQQHYSTYCKADSVQASSSSPALGRIMHTSGYLVGDAPSQTATSSSSSSSSSSTASAAGRQQRCWPWLCSTSMSQIDLTPLLAHLLGVPIPFGNLGKLPPHLFAALTTNSSTGSAAAGGGSAGAWLLQYAAALRGNAEQVHTYLNRYAVVGGLPSAALSNANKLYSHGQQLWAASQAAAGCSLAQEADEVVAAACSTPIMAAEAAEELVVVQLAFLNAAVDLARRRFTLFQQGPIWAGCAVGIAVLALQLACCWRAICGLAIGKAGGADCTTILLFTGLAAFHALGLFSVGLVMGEGRLQCVLLVAASLLMLRAALSAVLRARSLTRAAAVKSPGAANSTAAASQANSAASTDEQQPECSSGSAEAGSGAAYWCSWRPVATAVAAAVSMLACNVLLQAMGLIDRAGQDPHDKTQPSADLLVGPDAAWQQALLLCFTVGPLACIWLLVSWLSVWLGRCCPDQATVHQQLRGMVLCCLVWFVRGLCGVQYVTLGVFWVAQLSGHNDLTAPSAAKLAWANLQHFMLKSEALGRGWEALLAGLSSIVDVDAVYGVPQAALGSMPLGPLAQLPLRLLLPRVVYVSAVAAFCGTVAVVSFLASYSRLCKQAASKASSGSRGQHASAIGCQLFVWLCAVFAASLVMVLGYKGPATMLVAFVQAACCCVLLRVRAAAISCCANELERSTQLQPGSLQSVAGGGMVGMMALQLFFCSSHFCEFSGLQYAAAFIGFDSMVWYTSGSLLLLNTCGYLLLAVLSLPVFLVVCTLGQLQSIPTEHVQQQLACSMLVVNSMRFAALVVCMISAAVQQQHILLWAIFAPKLVFELWFMVVTDVGQVLASALAGLVL